MLKSEVTITVLIIFLASLSAWSFEKKLQSSYINFSGVEKFLELTALLEQDREPTPEQWDELFASPGYRILIKNEFRMDFFKERFELAFMPSKKSAMEQKLREEQGFSAQFLPHYLRVKQLRKQVEEQVRRLKTLSFVEAAMDCARKYLPDFDFKEYPPLAFVIFGPDARGYNPVVVDVLLTVDKRDEMIKFIAHEFHHYCRNRLFNLNQDRDILWVIDQIQGEGIADQINIGSWFRDKSLYALHAKDPRDRIYLEWYQKSPEIIRKMDSLFTIIADNLEQRAELGTQLKELIPLSGHPTGFFMANCIVEQYGKNAIVEVVRNPFRFFVLYNEAAKKSGKAPVFSDQTISFIKSLESKYTKK